MKTIDRLRQEYKLFATAKTSSEKYQREIKYNNMRLFCLDCNLLSFKEIEEMEFEVDNSF